MSSSPHDLRAGAGLAEYVAGSLRVLRAEMPGAYRLLCGMLAPREVLIVVDGEQVPLRFAASEARVLDRPQEPRVLARTSRRAILDVVDARMSLQEAVDAGVLLLEGTAEDLSRFHEGLLTYVRGAVRCPSFPSILDRFRAELPDGGGAPDPG